MLTLEWIGKNKVVNHHQEVPFRVLERQYSFGEQGQHTENNDSENMIIHGDNLEALKALLPQYEGKVKCIYIVILTPILMSILSSENAVRLNFIIHIMFLALFEMRNYKLGTIMEVSIQPKYYRLKIEELHLAFEYAQKKQQEKEEQKEARARMREEAKLAKEIEEERKKLEKEQQHYQNALDRINAQLVSASEVDRAAIEEKKAGLLAQLDKIDKEFKDVDYREANQRAGYVYVISNIGAFGENVYKIGMTRRLDPQDRVDELGDASVPFDFDVHAMIFSDDAPRLEAALHNAFADRKLNFVNQRREFFRVSLDEIKKVVKENYDRSVEFVELAPAEQYRESIKLREEAQKAKQGTQG